MSGWVDEMARVLVIDDDPDLLEILRYNLEAAGHEVRLASTGRDGLRQAQEHLPDLVLLDLTLPDMGGTSVCRQLKFDPATSATRVIIVSARGGEMDRVVGFELGADDYVVKPFSVRELLLRIKAVIGHRSRGAGPTTITACGSLRIDREGHRVWVDGREVRLTALQFRLLGTLYSRQGRVQSRAQLLSEVCGIETDMEGRTIDTLVKRLREKLRGAAKHVETVRGAGYRFSPEPEEGGAADEKLAGARNRPSDGSVAGAQRRPRGSRGMRAPPSTQASRPRTEVAAADVGRDQFAGGRHDFCTAGPMIDLVVMSLDEDILQGMALVAKTLGLTVAMRHEEGTVKELAAFIREQDPKLVVYDLGPPPAHRDLQKWRSLCREPGARRSYVLTTMDRSLKVDPDECMVESILLIPFNAHEVALAVRRALDARSH